jgi:hypothetical protein
MQKLANLALRFVLLFSIAFGVSAQEPNPNWRDAS